MFDLLKKRRILKYTKAAEEYLAGNYSKPAASPKFSMEPTFGKGLDRSSEKNNGDRYDALKQEWQARAVMAANSIEKSKNEGKGAGDVPDFVQRMINKMKDPGV